MLRGNLSTRPFYNERLIHWVLALAGVILVALTAFSAAQFLSLSRDQRALSTRIAQDEQRAQALRREAADVRRGIDATELETAVVATREVNAVIDQRVFSWTALFNTIERTIPPAVALRAVYPTIDKGSVTVRLIVNARRSDDVGAFMDALERTQTFKALQSVEELRIDDGSYVVTFDGQYVGHGTAALGGTTVTQDPPAAPGGTAPLEGR